MRNANDGISLSQTAEGALKASGDILQRVRELSVQSANATNSASDRKALQAEAGQLLSELDRIAISTEFNGQKLLDGSFGSAQFQIGANANQTITATTGNFRTSVYGAHLYQSESIAAAATADDTAGDITIDGLASETVTIAANATAADAAATINAVADKTGVTASARTVAQIGEFVAGSSYSLAVTSSNSTATNITFSVSANTASGLAEAVKAFNDASSQTGVTAKLNAAADGVILTNEAGDDINFTNNSAAGATFSLATFDAQLTETNGEITFGAALALVDNGDTAVSQGYLEFSSNSGFSFSASTSVLVTAADASALNATNEIDISTVDGSTRALKILDAALASVNGQRATFGALQARFETAISNLQITSENLSASRSRIQDADFAAETAALSRAQILQQAGTAMVAQANQIPQGVLQLLQG